MCYGAIGTQTGGSITRPASFCGVAGMKPDRMNSGLMMGGIAPFSRSLDHVGPIARTVDDLRILFNAIDYYYKDKPAAAGATSDAGGPRLIRLRGFFDRSATPDLLSAFDDAVRALEAHGAKIVDLDDPMDFEKIMRDHRTVMAAEAASVHSDWLDEFPDDYPARIRELILEGRSFQGPDQLHIKERMHVLLEGRSLNALEYSGALNRMQIAEAALSTAMGAEDGTFWITPATVSTAPDPSTTGDPAFNSPWSYTGSPTVSFPIGSATNSMPVAVQLVGRVIGDAELLHAAQWCEQAIRTWRQ
jgi:Asp-tRNA(Asn)/Glu-tRNA(Gln) amidotransferase A subunit family amidase